MKKIFKNKSRGEMPTAVLFGILGVMIIILIIVIINPFKKPSVTPEPKPQGPVQEVIVANVEFKLKEAKELGSLLKGSESDNPAGVLDLITTDRFIEVTITAENKGKENVAEKTWDLKDLYDEEGRRFSSPYKTASWIPEESECQSVIKPGFTPTLCTKIYEVSNTATGLKVEVSVREKGSASASTGLIDLGF